MRHHLPGVSLLVSILSLLGACSTPPAQPVPAASPAVATRPITPVLSSGVSVSPPQTGDMTVAFAQSRRQERTFPVNSIGANLVFTSNLRMPKMEAVETGPGRFQLRVRFSNASKTPILVSMACIYDGEVKAARSVRQLELPVNTFRDVVLDLEGVASRKLSLRASAVEATRR